jgi:hypothetical protein
LCFSLQLTTFFFFFCSISGKIATGETGQLGDISTLAEPQVVQQLIEKIAELKKQKN